MKPRVIETEEDHKAALREIEALAVLDPKPDTPDGDLLVVLVALVETYEKAHFPVENSNFNICDRHLQLLQSVGEVYDACPDPEEGPTLDEVRRQLATTGAADLWEFWVDASGAARSEELDADIAQLHQRGYLYLSASSHVVLTRRGWLTLARRPRWDEANE